MNIVEKLLHIISDVFYNLQVFIKSKLPQRKNISNKRAKINATVFYWLVLALPLLQFFIFYVVVNFNSFLLAFKKYTFDVQTATYNIEFAGLENFKNFAIDLFSESGVLKKVFSNSLMIYLLSLFFGVPFSLLFSYYIYKKLPLGKMFRIVLFLPSIISSIVMITLYTNFVDIALPNFFLKMGKEVYPPLSKLDSYFICVVVYGLWTGFGTTVLMYSSAMSRIPESVIEAGKIDGVGFWREFIQIVLPLIGPTISTFIIIGIAGLFTNEANLYAFSGAYADLSVQTLGYYLFIQVMGSKSTIVDYPYAAAGGLILALIATPVTLFVRAILNKYVVAYEY